MEGRIKRMTWYWFVILIYLTIGFWGAISGYIEEIKYCGRKRVQIREDLPVFLLITFVWLPIIILDSLWRKKLDRIAEKNTKKTIESFFQERNTQK